VVARWDGLHHVDPRPSKDDIVRGLIVDHVELRDDIVQVRARTGSETCQVNESHYHQTRIDRTEFVG